MLGHEQKQQHLKNVRRPLGAPNVGATRSASSDLLGRGCLLTETKQTRKLQNNSPEKEQVVKRVALP
jgi:hypothetical protein